MGQFRDAARTAFRDFATDGVPASGAHEPVKAEIREAFTIGDAMLTSVVDGAVMGAAVPYATRAGLYADLAHDAGKLGVVYDDSTAAYNGVYVKSGASGAGSWTITDLALPSTFAADLAALDTAVDGKQPLATALTVLASLTPAASKIPMFTSAGTASLESAGTGGLAVLSGADFNAIRTMLNLVVNTNVQAYDAGLLSIAQKTTAADQMLYTTASDTYAVTALTAFARTLLDDANASTARGTLGMTATGDALATAATAAAARTTLGFTAIGDALATAASTTAARTAIDAAPTSAGYARNQFYDSLDPATADSTSTGNVVVDVTDLDLLALGFTKALEKGSSSNVIYTRDLDAPLEGNEYFAATMVVKAADDASWGFARRLFGYSATGASVDNEALVTYEAIGANARKYSIVGQFDSGWAGVARLGLGVSTAGAGLQVMAGQFAVRPYPITGIDPEDFPGTPMANAVLTDVSADNQFTFGNNPDEAELLTSGNAVQDVADLDLLALGFDRAVGMAASGTFASYGQRLSRRLLGNEHVFARVYVHTDTADNFGASVRLQGYKHGGAVLAGTVFLTQEEKISSTAAIYSVAENLGADTEDWTDVDALRLAVAKGTASGLQIMGGQFAVAPRRVRSIERGDYPAIGTSNDPIYPAHLWLREGRVMDFYPQNIMQRRQWEFDPILAGFDSIHDTTRAPFSVEGPGQLKIDPTNCGSTGAIYVRQPGRIYDKRRSVPVTIHKAPATTTTSITALFIGDSHTDRATPLLAQNRFTAAGGTMALVGTITGRNETGTEADGALAEGRPGKKATEYVYLDTTLNVVAPGGEAAYLAGTNTDRINANPFLRAEVGSETNARNGYIFDVDHYLTRFGFADPDVVVINLGTNDITEDLESAPALVSESLEIMIDQTRTALPAAKILVWFTTQPRTGNADARWERGHRGVIEALNTLIRNKQTAGDTGVFFLPVYAHQSAEVGWETTGTPDADTGVLFSAISDAIHLQGSVREQAIEVINNAIMDLTS